MEARCGYDSRKSSFTADLCARFRFRIVEYENTQLQNVRTVGEMQVSLQEIRSGFEFVPGLFGIVLRGGYLYGAWPRTVQILIEFEFIVPEL